MKFASLCLSAACGLAGMALVPSLAAMDVDGNGALTLERLSHWKAADAEWDESAAEIVAFDADSKRLFVVNAHQSRIDIIDISDPAAPKAAGSIDTTESWAESGGANSVAVHSGLIAVAVEHDNKQQPGRILTYTTEDLSLAGSYTVGALPDMVTFTPDGSRLVVACEGEPSDDYLVDPEGQVAIINLATGAVALAGFGAFDRDALNARGVAIYGGQDHNGDGDVNDDGDVPSTAAQDLEPEYVAVSSDGTTAWVSCQENNALAVVDVLAGTITAVLPLGFKDGMTNAIDASNKDGGINFATYPIKMRYQPDSIAAFTVGGQEYLITANEGDAREYEGKPGYIEETRVAKVTLDPEAFPNAAALQDKAVLGRLKMTKALGDVDGDGDFDHIFAFGGRSFSIWNAANGTLVYDSGDHLERMTAKHFAEGFNASNDENEMDDRSDDKGPEPEAVTTAVINGATYAFIGLERVGGIAVYDVSTPAAPVFVTYVNHRDMNAKAEEDASGDYGPESIVFIPADQSPNGENLIVVGNEVSGTVALFQVH